MLDPATQAEVLRLFFTEKLSRRAIASKLGLHRYTVGAIIQRKSVQTNRILTKQRTSILAPYYPRIEALLKEDGSRSAVNILQKLRSAGYQGGLTILRIYLRTCRPTSEPKAFLSLEFVPGQAAQVDWGEFGDIFGLGRKVYAFSMVLCWSRMLYVEFTLSCNFESFIRCHEHAFRFFGGVPQEIWYDNLATAVAERRKKLVRFQPRFSVYTGHYNFKPIACNPRSGHEKGRVEDSIQYLRTNFWPGRSFQNLLDLNGQAYGWRDQFANRRTHGTTRKVPELMFQHEKPHLLPLREGFDTDEVRSVKASHQFRVDFDGNQYSVPWRLAGQILTLRASDQHVAIYYRTKCLTRHVRCWAKGEVIQNPRHAEGLRELKPGAQPDQDIAAIQSVGPHAKRYLEFMPSQTRSIRSELKQLLVLITVWGHQAVEDAFREALDLGVVGASHIERLLSRHEGTPPKPEPLELTDPRLMVPSPIVNLTSYDSLLMQPEKTKGDASCKRSSTNSSN